MSLIAYSQLGIAVASNRRATLCTLFLLTQAAGFGITAALSPANPIVGVTQVFLVGTATPGATVTENEIGPDGVARGPFTTVANAQGNYSMGPFIIQQLGVYNGTLRDSQNGSTTPISYSGSGNFSTSVNTTGQSIQRGGSASFVVTISSISGFAGTVNLAALNWSQIPGSSAFWSQSQVTVPSNSSVQATFTVQTSGSTNAGTYGNITLQGTNGSQIRGASQVSITVTAPAAQLTSSLSPANAVVGVTQAFLVGSGTPGATITESETGPDGAARGPFTTTVSPQGNYSMGPFVIQQLGTYTGTVRDSISGTQIPISYSGTGNFSITVNTSSRSIQRGSSASFVVTVSSISGFAGSVNLAALNWSQIPGSSASWSPSQVNVPSNGSAQATFTVQTSANTTVGTYSNIILQGTNGSQTRAAAPVSIIVTAPAAQLTSSLSPANAVVGVTQSFLVGSGTPGATITESETGPDGVARGPFTTTVNAQGSYSMGPFIIQQLGTYTGTVRDSISGQQIPISYSGVGNFSTTANNTSQSVARGGSASYTVTFTSVSGFAGIVVPAALNWSQISGAIASWNPTQVTVPSNGSASAVLTIQTGANTPSGTYSNITLQGSNGSATRTATPVSLTVTPPASSPTILSINPNPVPGSNIDQNVTVNGSGFQNGVGLRVRVTWQTGSTDLSGSQVTFISANQLTIRINVGTTAQNWTAQVINPDGSQSSSFPFSATAPGALSLDVQPTAPQALSPGQSLNYTITVRDGAGSGVNGATVFVFNPFNESTASTTTGSTGVGTYSLPIPASQVPAAYAVALWARKTGYADSGTTSRQITVLPAGAAGPPTILATPTSGSQGTLFRVTGTGFTPRGAVRRYIQAPGSGTMQEIGAISADDAGQIVWPWASTCGDMLGTWNVRTMDVSKNQQSDTVTETLTAAVSCSATMSIQTSPASGPQGTTFTITGTGFTPNGTVRRLLTAPGQGQQEISSIVADASGTITWVYTSNCQDLTGTWTLAVIDVGRNQQSNSVTETITSLASCGGLTFDHADLVDETVKDGTTLAAGAAYTKRWTLRNTGTTTWNSTYSLQFVSGDAGCPTTPLNPLTSVQPNQSYQFSLQCTAPQQTGSHRQNWHLNGPKGTVQVGRSSIVWTIINISSVPAQLIASLPSVDLKYKTGTVDPARESILLQSSGTDAPYSVEVITESPTPWLLVNALNATTPSTLTVSASTGLSAGNYRGRLVITSPAFPTLTIPVTLNVTAFAPQPGTPSWVQDLARFIEKYVIVGSIDPQKDTIVLTHGLSTSNECEKGNFWTGTGEKEASALIQKALGAKAKEVNIVEYHWTGSCTRSFAGFGYGEARDNVNEAGLQLSQRLIEKLSTTYSKKIQFIGHSLGTIVNSVAAADFFSRATSVKHAQFTALDRPHHTGTSPGFDSHWFAQRLLVNKRTDLSLRLDNYYAKTGLGFGDVASGDGVGNYELKNPSDMGYPVFEESENDHGGVHQYYRWSIYPHVPITDTAASASVCTNGIWDSSRILVPVGNGMFLELNTTLNPCRVGWNLSIIGPNADLVNPTNLPVENTKSDPLAQGNPVDTSPNSSACTYSYDARGTTRIACTEASSPYTAFDVTFPENAKSISFDYSFTSSGDGDTAAVLIDNTPIWRLNGLAATVGTTNSTGPIPITGLTGRRTVVIALMGIGAKNFGFELRNFQIQTSLTSCGITVGAATASIVSPGSNGTVSVTADSTTCPWTALSNAGWITITSGSSGTGNGTIAYSIAPNAGPARSGTIVVGGQTFTINQAGASAALSISPTSASASSTGGASMIAVTASNSWTATSNSSWITITGGTSGTGSGLVSFSAAANPATTERSGTITIGSETFSLTQAGQAPLGGSGVASYFVPITPCRAVDTRNTSAIPADSSRDFGFGSCNIPASATGLALNVTVVPQGLLGYLTIWPSGQTRPVVSTLNALDGRIKANAAIVGTGTNGAVSVYVTNATHVVLDVNGYFVPAGTPGALAFYPAVPCRVLDTRTPGSGGILDSGTTRKINGGGGCLPSQAQAYSLNVTAVPESSLGYLTIWPDGPSQPVVSTLNALTGTVVANAAIMTAGNAGAVNVFATNRSHLVVDFNGHFAPPGSPGALAFYPVKPCRINDTRNINGPFGGPRMEADTERAYVVPSSGCGIPSTAKAYVVNATVVPPGVFGFLTLWPDGLSKPLVSTLNAVDGAITSNAAILPASTAGVVRTYTSSAGHLLLDVSGYFAPIP